MSAEPCEPPSLDTPYEVIHLGGQAAAVVPLAELRQFQALRQIASPEEVAEAEDAAAYQEWQEDKAAGRTSPVEIDEVWRRLGLVR